MSSFVFIVHMKWINPGPTHGSLLGFMRLLRKNRIHSYNSRKILCQLFSFKVGMQLTHEVHLHMHCLEVHLVACASTYTRERIYTIHVSVTVLRGSAVCGLRNLDAETYASDHIHATHVRVYVHCVCAYAAKCNRRKGNVRSDTNVLRVNIRTAPCTRGYLAVIIMLLCRIYNESIAEQRYVCKKEMGWCSCVPMCMMWLFEITQ